MKFQSFSRRSFLRGSSAITASALLGNIVVPTSHASFGPTSVPTGGASVTVPGITNIQSVEIVMKYTIVWLLKGGGSSSQSVTVIAGPGQTVQPQTYSNSNATFGEVLGPE